MNETAIKRMIVDYLERLPGCFVLPISIGSLRGGHKSSMKRGTPDLLIGYRGRMIGIEVKTPTGKQSPEQKHIEIAMHTAGCVYILARGLDDVIQAFKRLPW